jgi:hypothetical protein
MLHRFEKEHTLPEMRIVIRAGVESLFGAHTVLYRFIRRWDHRSRPASIICFAMTEIEVR